MGPWSGLALPFALSGSIPAETASARERRRWFVGSRRVLCGTRFGARKMLCRREGWKEPQGGRRWRSMREMPGSKGSVDVVVEEAPAASEYTKMGGCVGLRLSRVTWSYVLALGLEGDQSPESPFSSLHSPSGLGHRGIGDGQGQLQATLQATAYQSHSIHYTTPHRTHSAARSIPDTEVWSRLVLCPGPPRTSQDRQRYRSNLPGQLSRAKAAAVTPSRAS